MILSQFHSLRSLLLITIAVLAGCGGGQDEWEKQRPKVFRAGGTVILEGAPLDDALVIYHSGDQAAQGRTNADGEFTLTTFDEGDGAVAGTHKVTISKTESYYAPTKYDSPEEPSKYLKQKQLLPAEYTRPESTPLSADVSSGGSNQSTFEIKR